MDWSKVKVKVQPRSGFDKFHTRKTTSFPGTLVPLLVDELLPNSEFSGEFGCQIGMAPLASDIDPRCDYCLEAFLVPHRLLYGGFEGWLTGKNYNGLQAGYVRPLMPYLNILPADASYLGINKLYPRLGMKLDPSGLPETGIRRSLLAALAYHRIYDDWYRNAKIQTPVFTPRDINIADEYTASDLVSLSALPFISVRNDDGVATAFRLSGTFDDGVHLGDLRQRNFDSDMFTEALASPQFGDEQSITINTGGASTLLTISAIRAINSMQQFEERNNLASPRLQDYCSANYGADLSSGVAQRAICIGSARIKVSSASVAQVSPNFSDGKVPAVLEDLNALGYRGGSAYLDDNNIFHFHGKVQEPCFLMVIGSLVPRAQYASGTDPLLLRYCQEDGSGQSDMANPILQNVGYEAIPQSLLTLDASDNNDVFGYTDRYYGWMDKRDFVDGLFTEGESLSVFTPQRFFDGPQYVGSNFLEIPIDYLDGIAAVTTTLSRFGYWLDGVFKYGVSQPLQKYGIPTLQDPAYEHGHTVTLQRNGSRL